MELAIKGQTSEFTLPETNSSHLKMDGWNTIAFPFGAWEGLFSGANLLLVYRSFYAVLPAFL